MSTLFYTTALHTRANVQIKNGWIFSGPVDGFIFIGVGLIAIGLIFFLDGSFSNLHFLFVWYLAVEGLDRGHSFSTIYPSLFFVNNRQLSWLHCFLGVFVIVAICFILFHVVNKPYIGVIGSILMWHFTRQNVGWIHISSSRSGEKRSWIDDFMIYNVCGVPFLYYLAHPEISPNIYHMDLSFVQIQGNWAPIFLTLFWGYNIFYIIYQIYILTKNKWKTNFAKYIIILSGLLCFAVPYIMFPQKQLLILPMLLVHVIPYVFFTYHFSKEKSQRSPNSISNKWKLLLKNPLFYLTFFLIFGWVFNELARSSHWWGPNIVVPLVYSLGVIHTIADGHIWKRRFSPEINNWTYSIRNRGKKQLLTE